MDIANVNQLFSEPLIPAFSILLSLVLVFLAYKYQMYRQSLKPMSHIQLPLVDENIKKRRPQQDPSAPLVVPSSNKTQGVTTEARQTPVLTAVELDDDPQDKPLFPTQVSTPHKVPEKSCDDLYKELLDPDKFEEALYNELLEGTGLEDKTPASPAKEPESKPAAPVASTPEKSSKPENESELLLTEIEKEFLELEKDLHGDLSPKSVNQQNYDAVASLDDNSSLQSTNSLPQKDLSVNDLQLEMEETIAKLSQQLESKETSAKEFKIEKPPKKEVATPKKIENAKPTPKTPEIPANPPSKSPSRAMQEDSSNQYVKRLQSFQSNLEQRFGSFDIANDPIRNKTPEDDSLVDRIAYSAGNGKDVARKNSLELLESFLFTAKQKHRK